MRSSATLGRIGTKRMSGNIRVIIAEDHALVREGTRELIERAPDIEVVGEATNGAEAVDLVERLAPDVAIVDILMPVMNGIEATGRMKAIQPSLAVLILTAYDDDQYVFALLRAGQPATSSKTFRLPNLFEPYGSCMPASLCPPHHRAQGAGTIRRRGDARGRRPGGPPGPSALHLTPIAKWRCCAWPLAYDKRSDRTRLYFSVRTVQVHMTHIFDKLDVGSRTEAVIAGLRRGLISLEDVDVHDD